MKRLLTFALCAAATLLVCACQEKNGGGKKLDPSPTLELLGGADAYTIPCDGDSFVLGFHAFVNETPAAWTASTDADWCTVDPVSGTGPGEVNVVVQANETSSERTATVTITSGDKKVTKSIKQSLYAGALPAESWFSKNYWERTDREQAGFRGPVKCWYDAHYTTFHKFYYDTAGHLVKDEYHDTEEGSVTLNWEHFYDDAGHRIKSQSLYDDGGQNGMFFTFEYENKGKFVATSAYVWVPIYVSGLDFPVTIFKDLSAIHYLDTSPAYYAKTDMTFVFGDDGNLTITEESQVGRDGEVQKSTNKVLYENGYPVSCAEAGVMGVTYAANGIPLTLSERSGKKTWTFVKTDKMLLMETMKEPNASGMVAEYWSEYKYNANGDETEYKRAYFTPDDVYVNTYSLYFYDSYGNWIQRRESIEPAFQKGEFSVSTVDRVIEYY